VSEGNYTSFRKKLSFQGDTEPAPDEGSYESLRKDLRSAPTQYITNAIDAGIGSELAAKGVDKFVPKSTVSRTFMQKIPGFIGRQILPRVAGGFALSELGPLGMAAGFVAPEAAYEVYEKAGEYGEEYDRTGALPGMDSSYKNDASLIDLAKSGNEAAVEALGHRDRIDGGNRTSALLPKTPDVYDKIEVSKNNTMSPAVLNNVSGASAEDFPDDFDGVVMPRGGFESLGYTRHPVTNKWVK